MNGELDVYPSKMRNAAVFTTSITLILVFGFLYILYLRTTVQIDVVSIVFAVGIFVLGMQLIGRLVISFANILHSRPRIHFNATDITFDLPFLSLFSIPTDDIKVIYRDIGPQKMTPITVIFSPRESMVFILKNRSHHDHTSKANMLNRFANLAYPGRFAIGPAPSEDYFIISDIFYAPATSEVFKTLNARGFTKTNPSWL